MSNITEDGVLQVLNYPSFFKLSNQSLPTDKQGIIDKLSQEKFIIKNKSAKYDITNLGAILFANNLLDFPATKRKTIRVITYI